MAEIYTYPFKKEGLDKISSEPHGTDWPVVYLLCNEEEMYIGETINLHNRTKQHFHKPERKNLGKIYSITDDQFNKSATLDIESWLIQYISADGKFKLQNGNDGLQNHSYYERDLYRAKFETTWNKLMEYSLVRNDLEIIKNSEIFKYSPYKTLSDEQLRVITDLEKDLLENKDINTYIVEGKPGTGKTVLATYLIKHLKDKEKTKDMKIALVIAMKPLRNTLQKVFKNVSGLKANMVVGPSKVVGEEYDLLVVDEAHRLKQRKSITNYRVFDQNNEKLGLGKEGTQLDWILMSSKNQVLFYDKNQTIRPADVNYKDFKKLNKKRFILKDQMRVEGGKEYVEMIHDLFEVNEDIKTEINDYDFKIYDDFSQMVNNIKEKNKKYGLSRLVASYAWEWKSKKNPDLYDIEIDDQKLRWNSTTNNWVNSKNAINEVGCIHTVQGYDLNYTGIIVGSELSFNPNTGEFVINKEKYYDRNGWRGINNKEELKRYIINIYKTLFTRGIKGTYVYFVDKNVEKYFKKAIGKIKEEKKTISDVINSTKRTTVKIPLVGKAPCGDPLLGEENIEKYIEVSRDKIKSGYKYFILKAIGDSMNLAGIEDGDLVLCRKQIKADTGDRVVALLDGEEVTIKIYDKKDGLRILLPKSTNEDHQPIKPEEGDSVQGVAQEVLE